MAMDVSPMSMQMIYPRATDAGQVQHNLNQAAALQQDFEAIRRQKDDELKQQQVRTKDDTEDGRIRDDPERQRGQGGYGGGSQKKSQKQADEELLEMLAKDPMRGRRIDISF